eukprot:NODE_2205_length_1175_cov_19.842806_g1827_i0.p10 GENE.NODE_2205_length_1175_cov_19.842806_g1827_i0~~NODE_2205_length_1175_cov_19.842806_g1827_i0.p10  ORF type:complete len:64 (-),score=2.56 NODE_2205_length_1175_cov_19.842806_g1827_i0:315-506(-)
MEMQLSDFMACWEGGSPGPSRKEASGGPWGRGSREPRNFPTSCAWGWGSPKALQDRGSWRALG